MCGVDVASEKLCRKKSHISSPFVAVFGRGCRGFTNTHKNTSPRYTIDELALRQNIKSAIFDAKTLARGGPGGGNFSIVQQQYL